LNNKWKR